MENVKPFIKELGGPTFVADQLNTTPQNVINMYNNGIPWKFRNTVHDLAESAEVDLPDNYWK